MDKEPDNHDRAQWAQAAVTVFQDQTGTDKDDAIADLIADLCHLADEYDQDALEQVRRGVRMYLDERDYPDGWAPNNMLANVEINYWRGPID
jgi:hypothetical protein